MATVKIVFEDNILDETKLRYAFEVEVEVEYDLDEGSYWAPPAGSFEVVGYDLLSPILIYDDVKDVEWTATDEEAKELLKGLDWDDIVQEELELG